MLKSALEILPTKLADPQPAAAVVRLRCGRLRWGCSRWGWLLAVSLGGALLLGQSAVWAQLKPVPDPPDLDLLKDPSALPEGTVLGDRISPTGLTMPSLWWIREQFTEKNYKEGLSKKLIVNWIAYPRKDDQPGRIDFVVNRQFWSLLDYLQRYAFVNEFGSAAREYGYNIRVFDNLATYVGAYTCAFDAVDLSQTSPESALSGQASIPCRLDIDSAGKAGFRGRTPGLQ
jgi:hypothetical protein